VWHDHDAVTSLRSLVTAVSRGLLGPRRSPAAPGEPSPEQRRAIEDWEAAGRPVPPPPEVKQDILRRYATQFGLRTFVETGTFFGDSTAAVAPHVERAVTIELSPELAARARQRFAGDSKIEVLEGDSGRLLPEILAELREPALFWLDGHYSAGITARGDEDTPVRRELRAILDHDVKSHVILIDDARDFAGGTYPTVAEVEEMVRGSAGTYDFDLRDDIIRVTPRGR
jgi:hypothetical protein